MLLLFTNQHCWLKNFPGTKVRKICIWTLFTVERSLQTLFFLCFLWITAPSWTLIQLIIIDSYFFFKLLTIGSLYFFQWKGTWYYSFQWKSSDFEKTFEKHFWKPFEKHSSECHLVKNTISPMVINYNPCKITIKYYYIA